MAEQTITTWGDVGKDTYDDSLRFEIEEAFAPIKALAFLAGTAQEDVTEEVTCVLHALIKSAEHRLHTFDDAVRNNLGRVAIHKVKGDDPDAGKVVGASFTPLEVTQRQNADWEKQDAVWDDELREAKERIRDRLDPAQ